MVKSDISYIEKHIQIVDSVRLNIGEDNRNALTDIYLLVMRSCLFLEIIT